MKKIKLQKVHLHDAKPLSRTELKNVFGGNTPTSPGGGGNYKCCSNNSDRCSDCVYINSNPVCSTGSYVVKC